MTAWTGDIVGMGGENNGAPKSCDRHFQEPGSVAGYDRYRLKAAQAQGLMAIIYIPKGVTVAASDTFTLTVAAP